jgi:hypothetical protein
MKKKLLICGALVCSFAIMGAAVLGYQDWQLRGSAPGNPASGFLRIWADSTAGYFKCLTSAGAVCHFEGTASSSIKGIVQPDGTATHYLDGTGAWSTPAGGGGGGGGMSGVLDSGIATVGTTSILTFTAWPSSSYSVYLIALEDIVPSASGVTIQMRCSTNGGTSYDSASSYYTSQVGGSTGGVGGGGPGQATSILLMPFNGRSLGTTSGEAQSAAFYMWNPASTALRKRFTSMAMYDFDSAGTQPQLLFFAANYQNTAAVNAIQIYTPSGTFGGVVRVYAYTH